MSADYVVTQHGEWQIAVAPTENMASSFIAWGKVGRIVGPNALFEPGDVHFEFGDTAVQARERLIASLPRLSS